MPARKSPSNHLPLLQWKAKMKSILQELNEYYDSNGNEWIGHNLMSDVKMGWIEYLDQCQEFSGPRITTLYPSGLHGVFIKKQGLLRIAEQETGGIKVSPQQYVKIYYTDGKRDIAQIIH